MTVHPYTGERIITRPWDGSTYEQTLQPATVYTFSDSQGRVLYVGCTTMTSVRFKGHAVKDWWTDVASIALEHFEDKRDGLRRERLLIRELLPLHNVAGLPESELARRAAQHEREAA